MLQPMDLRTFLSQMTVSQREAFAKRCSTSAAHLRNVSYGAKTCGETLAMDVERESGGAVSCEELRPDLAERWAYMRSTGKRSNQPVASCTDRRLGGAVPHVMPERRKHGEAA